MTPTPIDDSQRPEAAVIDPHPCDIGDGEIDHDWKFNSDWNEGGQWHWWECKACGAEDHEREPPELCDDN